MTCLLPFLVVIAQATMPMPPPSWSPDRGWDDFDQRAAEMQAAHEARVAESRRQFEETSKKMDEDFERSSRTMFLVFGAFAVAIIVVGGIEAARRRRRAAEYVPEVTYVPLAAVPQAPAASTDVSVLRIAIDGRASKFVRTELARIVEAYDGESGQGRAKRLREVSVLLRRVRDAWMYGGAVNEPMRAREAALAVAARHIDDARVRFTSSATPVVGGDSSSLILVTIVVAARGELATVSQIGAGEDLRRALEAAAYREADDLVAVELVWMPAESDRTLSAHQLESFYPPPDLYRLQGALGDKTFCGHCNGPYPAELVTCPHCGAPAPRRAA